MKISRFLLLISLAFALFSCKQEVDPTLIVTVNDTLGHPVYNARIFTHPCIDTTNDQCDRARLNKAFIKEALTNSMGQASFVFPYSAIIDVQAQWTNCDTPTVWCLDVGQTVARFETKKLKKDEKNEYNVKLTLYSTN